TPLVVTWAGRTGLGRIEGLLAGGATALYGPLIFADGSLEKEGFATFWTALALGLTAKLSHSGRFGHGLGAGPAWGAVGLLRSNAILVAPVALVWVLLFRCDRSQAEKSRGWRLAAFWLAGFVLVLAPVSVINTAVSKPRELLGTTWQLGPNFYIGNG